MKISAVIIATGLAMAGCASLYEPNAKAWIACEGARCERIWQRAQTWLVTHARYRIQIANDSVIQTYGPHENVSNAVAYTVTRETRNDGKTQIVIRGTCNNGSFGMCFFDPSGPTNKLFHELDAIK